MKLLNTKTFDELMEEGLTDMESVGISTTKGSIARLFLAVINKLQASFYDCLQVNHIQAFVTTAKGAALDQIGALMNCKRNEKETDNEYRIRICHTTSTMATSNETSVYLAALSVDGVSDIRMIPYSMGTGSFSILVLPEVDLEAQKVLANVSSAVAAVKAYGINYDVRLSTDKYVSIVQQITLDSAITDTDRQELRYNVQLAIIDYINHLSIGEEFIIDQLTTTILNVSKHILSTQNVSFQLNGRPALYTSQTCRWFERFVVSKEPSNIVVL